MKILKQIYGAAKINYIFETEFKESLYSLNLFERLKNEDIYWTIKNSQGLNQAEQFSNDAFEMLVSKPNEQLNEPLLLCLTRVEEEIKLISSDIIKDMKEIALFTDLDQSL